VSFTFILSYVFGNPLLYGTPLIPIAAISALCAFFMGAGLITSSGPGALPLRYMTGSSTQARMLRIFIPLVVGVVLIENIAFFFISSFSPLNDAVQLSASLVIFIIGTVYVVSLASTRLGRALDQAEQELVQKNEELGALNEELTASGEELRQANEELLKNEAVLRESQKENAFLADLLNRSDQPFGVRSVDGKIVMVNRAFEELTGYTARELGGIDPTTELTPPEWRGIERAKLGELERTGTPVRYQKEYRRKDGSLVAVELFVHLVSDSNGKPVQYYSFATDITERKRIEQELRDTHLRLSHHLENSPLAIIEFDAQFRITRWSDEAVRIFGWAAYEVMGKAISEFTWVHEGDVERVAAISADMLSGRAPRNMHANRNYRKDGTVVHCEWYNSAIRDDSGNLISVLSLILDVTERDRAAAERDQKNEELGEMNEELTAAHEELQQHVDELTRAEAELQAASAQRQLALDAAKLGWWHYDPVSRIARYDEQYRTIFGVMGEEKPNDEILATRIHPEDLPALWAKVEAALDPTEPKPYSAEYRINLPDGRVRWIEAHGTVTFEGSGESRRAKSFVGTVEDITGRREADMRLREIRHRLETLILSMRVGILLVLGDKIGLVNQTFCDYFGLREAPGELTGLSSSEMIEKIRDVYLDPDKEVRRINEIVLQGDPVIGEEIAIRGRRMFLRDYIPILFEGKISGRLWYHIDITERKRVEEVLQQNLEELSRREHELSEALAEKEVLLSEIHHRVKNNLSAFISLLSLEGSYDDSPAGITLKKDLQNRARSMALIHETLYRTRKYSTVEMDLYLKTLVGQITGTYALPGGLQVQVEADGIVLDLSRATTCGLIVNELVTNSFKYAFSAPFDCTDTGGRICIITVTLGEEWGKYVLRIRDNGIGLPAGFDARNARSLGLKLVNFLAKHQLRATVDVRSGPGTEFELRFPVNQQHRKDP
jgi:PAS domain S-box-containing protein